MTILFITNMYPSKEHPDYGIFVRNIETLLMQGGYKVQHAVVKKTDGHLKKIFQYIICYVRAVIIGMFGSIDCVCIHFISHTFIPAKIIKKIKKDIPIVGAVYGEDVCQDFECYKANRKRAEKALKIIDKLIVPSEYFCQYIVKEYGYSSEKIWIFPSGGVNDKIFHVKNKILCKRKNNFDSQFFWVGFASRIVEDKGWDTFVDAVAILMEKYNDKMKFVIAGDGKECKEMEEKIILLGLSRHICRFPLMSQEQLADYFNALDVFCFPTRRKSESLGLVGIEAMCCGTVCIISDGPGGQGEYARDGFNSLLFRQGKARCLAGKIEQVFLMDEELRNKMQQQAINTGVKYRMEEMRKPLVRFFNSIL